MTCSASRRGPSPALQFSSFPSQASTTSDHAAARSLSLSLSVSLAVALSHAGLKCASAHNESSSSLQLIHAVCSVVLSASDIMMSDSELLSQRSVFASCCAHTTRPQYITLRFCLAVIVAQADMKDVLLNEEVPHTVCKL